MLDPLYDLPFGTLAALTAIVFVGTYWVGCLILRPVLRLFVRSGGGENDIVGNVLSAFGVFYGLLLSLIAVAAYQNLNRVDGEVVAEVAAIVALYQEALELPEAERGPLVEKLRDYCRFVIEEEWPVQREGLLPRGARPKIAEIRDQLRNLKPRSRRDEIILTDANGYLKAMEEYGRHRRYATQSGIPLVMWYVVIVGAAINIGLVWLFDMRFVTQLFLGGLLAFFLGSLILLIAVLDRPYRSLEFGVSPKAHRAAYQLMTGGEIEGAQSLNDVDGR